MNHRRNALIVAVAAVGALMALSLGWIFVLRFLRRTEEARTGAEGEALAARALATAKQKEMEIAARIQTEILPRERAVPGASVSASMFPASEVGGDYYEVIPVEDGFRIAIGDVSGHGISAGVVMLMVQSAFAAIVRQDPNISPNVAVEILNRTLYENLRKRLKNDDHVTLTVIRYFRDGRLVCSSFTRTGSPKRRGAPTNSAWIGSNPSSRLPARVPPSAYGRPSSTRSRAGWTTKSTITRSWY